jgi:hypothetical protein
MFQSHRHKECRLERSERVSYPMMISKARIVPTYANHSSQIWPGTYPEPSHTSNTHTHTHTHTHTNTYTCTLSHTHMHMAIRQTDTDTHTHTHTHTHTQSLAHHPMATTSEIQYLMWFSWQSLELCRNRVSQLSPLVPTLVNGEKTAYAFRKYWNN